MANPFSDLIPQQTQPPVQAGGGNPFGDLIPNSNPPQGGGVTEIAKGGVPQQVQAGMQASAAPGMSVPEDVARSGATGLAEGVIGIQGLPGEMDNIARKGAQWLLSQLGLPEGQVDLSKMPSLVPDTDQITGAVQGVTGEFHEPQTTAGEYARTAGQFAPAAAGGAGGLARRGAQALVPAVASETAGQVARDVAPEYEGAARVGTALATGGVGARGAASKTPKGLIPSTEELADMANRAYKRADDAGLVITGGRSGAFGPMAIGLTHKLKKEGLDQTIHPKAWAAINRMIEVADNPQTLQEMDTLRRVARGAAKSIEPDERRLGQIMIGRIDEFLDNLSPKDVQAGNVNQGVNSLKEARSLWQRMRKSEMIDDMLDRAGIREGQFSVSGKENAIRTEFRQLAMKMSRDKRTRNMFTKEEQKLVRQLSNMGSGVNILRTLGKLAPRSALSLGGGAAYAYSGDPVLTGAAWGGGELARLGALALTKRKVGQLQNRVRSGGAEMRPGVPSSPASAALSAQASTLPYRDQ